MIRKCLRSACVLATLAVWHTVAAALPPMGPAPEARARIIQLTALGPDERTHTLYSDPQGFPVTLNRPGRIAEAIAGDSDLPEGIYHTLTITYGDRFEVVSSEGIRPARFSEQGLERKRRIGGMVIVENGHMVPVRVVESPGLHSVEE